MRTFLPPSLFHSNFPTSVSVCEGLQGIGGGGGGEGEVGRGAGGEGVRTSRKRSREDLDTQSVDLNFRVRWQSHDGLTCVW